MDAYNVEIALGNPISISELVANYLRAVERFRTHDSQATEGAASLKDSLLAKAALSEALDWADTIDQYLSAGPQDTIGTDRDSEWAAKFSSDQEQLVRAFARVRNLVHHRWWEAVATRIKVRAGEPQVNEWVWAGLPDGSGQGRGKDAAGDAAFAAALKGRPVMDTLDALAEIFWAKRGWQITREDIEQPGHGVGSLLAFD